MAEEAPIEITKAQGQSLFACSTNITKIVYSETLNNNYGKLLLNLINVDHDMIVLQVLDNSPDKKLLRSTYEAVK